MIKLKEIVDAMEISVDEARWYYDSSKHEVLMAVEYVDEYAPLIDDIESKDEMISLPDRFEVDDYKMMRRFAVMHSEELLYTLEGKRVFRKFKDKVFDLGVEEAWYAFKDEWYKKVATEWCDRNNIEFEAY